MTGTRRDLVRYRFSRAHEALEDAQVLARAGRWNACVNRLYYACFYAASAVLSERGFSSSKHSGIRSLFNHHLVKSGEISTQLAATYNDLFERRRESDYLDFGYFDEARVRPWLGRAEAFVESLARVSTTSGKTPGTEEE